MSQHIRGPEVWADGYGNWFAKVPRGATSSIRALADIADALGERYDSLDLHRLRVREVEHADDTVTYTEEWSALRYEFVPSDMDYVTMEKIIEGRGFSKTRGALDSMARALRLGQKVEVIIYPKESD